MDQIDQPVRQSIAISVILALGLTVLGLLIGELVQVFWGWKTGLLVGGIVTSFGQYRLTQMLIERWRSAKYFGSDCRSGSRLT